MVRHIATATPIRNTGSSTVGTSAMFAAWWENPVCATTTPSTRNAVPAAAPHQPSQRGKPRPVANARPSASRVTPLHRWKNPLRAFSRERIPSATRKAAALSAEPSAMVQASMVALSCHWSQ